MFSAQVLRAFEFSSQRRQGSNWDSESGLMTVGDRMLSSLRKGACPSGPAWVAKADLCTLRILTFNLYLVVVWALSQGLLP